METVDELRNLAGQANHIVAFTGAGISAESGIPTYRGEDGVWHKYDPAKYASINYFQKNPAYYWNFFQEVRYPGLKKAKPNRAHQALATLEEKGNLQAVITQNIDGLHQMAGSRRVLELHGNTTRFFCLECGDRHTMDDISARLETQLPPTCSSCGGLVRPDVVFFGETLPHAVLEEARREAMGCDLFLAVGSSLVVQPAATLPVIAKEQGARLVIINLEATPLDSIADAVFHASASDVLCGLV